MPKGFGLKTPLNRDESIGLFAATTNMIENTKQNLKCLILTNPGERVMDPDFGVGIRQYLFENYEPTVVGDIKMRIGQQCSKYLHYVQITNVDVSLAGGNNLYVVVSFFIPVLYINDQISILLPKAI